MSAPRRLPTLAALALSAAALAACGGGDGGGDTAPKGGVLDQTALEKDLTQRLSDASGKSEPKVDCPGDLPVKKDLTMRCTATLEGTTYGLTVTVTGVEGGNASYDVAVDQTPQ